MARRVADPELHAGQAVECLGALKFFPVSRAVKGGNVVRSQEVFPRLPAVRGSVVDSRTFLP